jgi:hypothetical protein
MAVFENLLPEPHNTIILDLLFDLASWHAYAKLRMHTTDTLDFLDTATTILGQSVRKFYKTTCDYYYTTELPDEYAARGHREAALAAKKNLVSAAPGKRKAAGPKHKSLNISTYKFHALGDYANTIRQRGTTDNYTTQPVSFILTIVPVLFSYIPARANLNIDTSSDGTQGHQRTRRPWLQQ